MLLKERKCMTCKNLFRGADFLFEHKCKAYPNGIPAEILEEDTSHHDCKSNDYHFEQNANRS